ncbi:hypothetical protein D9M70_514510 [compost metagenome]
MREELAGNPRYSTEQENATLRDQAESLQQLSDYFGQLGVDLDELTDEEALALLRNPENAQRLEQVAIKAEGSTPYREGIEQAAREFATFGEFSVSGKDLQRDGQKIGSITLRRDGNRLVIDDIEVNRRGQGAGTAAIEALASAAAERGLSSA